MLPALPPRTYIIGLRWYLRLSPGNVIVFEHDGKEKVKRIIKANQDGALHVQGDHAVASTDSRQFGDIAKDNVIAKVIWPRTGQKVL